MAICLARGLAGVRTVPVPISEHRDRNATVPARQVLFRDDFEDFNQTIWRCEYSCPVIETGKARFRLRSGVEAETHGSWSKASYKPRQFTSGRFTVRIALTERPNATVWWGVALWDNGPAANLSQYNEINFGYTTDQLFGDTELRVESTKLGKYASVRVDTGVDLYDEQWHVATLEYDANHVSFYLDGNLLQTITDRSVIPTDPMHLVLGPRLVRGDPMTTGFTQSIDWVEVEG
ncbi:hypothetical protein B0I35DRAFT_453764 [Stachybotrys elegans]|uniref:GH16 domain-containing protein n=1 Tax=Stachybotrys elegans TaxID=80388 RepID=A0A8K0WLS5_9HYPO|nr:hypothetical protein B0I35DRAFT_453764 [Stachybotrys elegans]